MLVDLARNDVGRVVEFGTCQVDEMMTLERYSHVMHLTSQVSGQLAEGKTPIDVLRATLPAGTVSGAPKVRAMEIIDDLEPSKRGPYAGVVGYLDFGGAIDTAIAIRTMVCTPDGRASVQAGAGVVADSVPEHEELECRNKAKALLAAVPAARRMTAARRAHADGHPLTALGATDPVRRRGPTTGGVGTGRLGHGRLRHPHPPRRGHPPRPRHPHLPPGPAEPGRDHPRRRRRRPLLRAPAHGEGGHLGAARPGRGRGRPARHRRRRRRRAWPPGWSGSSSGPRPRSS